MSIVELKGLTKEYGPNIGCFDVNLTIDEGKVYGFIGPNGAGKTTVIRQMIGFIKPDKGIGTILNYDIWKQANEIIKSLGYLSGEVILPDYMTGIKYLKLIADIRGNVDWKYTEKLIAYFDLDAKRKIKKMSKGMKQKVAIISAFMHKPKILILDEPTSGLDPLMQEKFKTLVKNSRKDGSTIFMSSHVFGEIENTCDQVGVIKDGRIISEVIIKDLKENAEKQYEIRFSVLKDYQSFISKKWDILKKEDVTKTITVKVLNSDVDKFLKELANYKIDYFKELPFNLEDYFIKFYQKEIDFND